jgi:hypothetical protein
MDHRAPPDVPLSDVGDHRVNDVWDTEDQLQELGPDAADVLNDELSLPDTQEPELPPEVENPEEVDVQQPDPCENMGNEDSDGDGLSDLEECLAGLDPQRRDTDTDGIPDGQEVLVDHTDPLDPSSAVSWHPEFSGHPKMSFGPADLEMVRTRAKSGSRPHAFLWTRVKAEAGKTAVPSLGSFSAVDEFYRSVRVKAAAFVALIEEDPVAAQRAVTGLETLNPNFNEVTFAHPEYNHADIFGADALIQYVAAWDFLAGSGLVEAEVLAALRERILDMAQQLDTNAHLGHMMVLLATSQNNHNIKTMAALGYAGLCFNDDPRAARWVNLAVTDLHWYWTQGLASPSGAYAEGPHYMLYAVANSLLFAKALSRATQGETWMYRNFFVTRDPEGDEMEWVSDLLASDILTKPMTWIVRIVAPDLKTPNFDDGHCELPLFDLFHAMRPDGDFLWGFHREDYVPDIPSSLVRFQEEVLALFPEDTQGQLPSFDASFCDVAGGACVFRTGFGPLDTWVMMLGEHGVVRTAGGMHQHPHANAVTLFARGEHLLLDGGYINWANKSQVDKPENHNLVLVNGMGPPNNPMFTIGSDTFLSDYSEQDEWFSAVGSTSYEGTDFRRTAILTPQNILLVLDEVTGPSTKPLRWMWHGNGGGTSGGTAFLDQGVAVYARPATEMQVAVVTTAGAPTLSLGTFKHGYDYGQVIQHSALQADIPAQSVRTLTAVRWGERTSPVANPVSDLPLMSADYPISEVAVVEIPGEAGILVAVVSNVSAAASVSTACGEVTPGPGLTVVTCLPGGENATVREW